jgi:hypothetical protein
MMACYWERPETAMCLLEANADTTLRNAVCQSFDTASNNSVQLFQKIYFRTVEMHYSNYVEVQVEMKNHWLKSHCR